MEQTIIKHIVSYTPCNLLACSTFLDEQLWYPYLILKQNECPWDCKIHLVFLIKHKPGITRRKVSNSLQQSKDIQMRSTGYSKSPIGVNVSVKTGGLPRVYLASTNLVILGETETTDFLIFFFRKYHGQVQTKTAQMG